jgi:hypothetical protein
MDGSGQLSAKETWPEASNETRFYVSAAGCEDFVDCGSLHLDVSGLICA